MHCYTVILSDGSQFCVYSDNWYEAVVDAIREAKHISSNEVTVQSITL